MKQIYFDTDYLPKTDYVILEISTDQDNWFQAPQSNVYFAIEKFDINTKIGFGFYQSRNNIFNIYFGIRPAVGKTWADCKEWYWRLKLIRLNTVALKDNIVLSDVTNLNIDNSGIINYNHLTNTATTITRNDLLNISRKFRWSSLLSWQ